MQQYKNPGQKIKNFKKYVIAAIINSESAAVIDEAVTGTPKSDFEKVFQE